MDNGLRRLYLVIPKNVLDDAYVAHGFERDDAQKACNEGATVLEYGYFGTMKRTEDTNVA